MDNPEQLLRKPRKSTEIRNEAERPDRLVAENLVKLAKSIEAPLVGRIRRSFNGAPELSSGEGTSSSRGTDSEQSFNRARGYLPPLDEEAAAIIDAIIADPDMAKDYKRINPNSKGFTQGLRYRNVFLTQSAAPDPYIDHIAKLVVDNSFAESEGEEQLHGHLWTLDQARCNKGSSEALFQRTLMMSLIARHSFIYDTSVVHRHSLDFSVEEPWTCPAMPTRAYDKGAKYLTQPKPDLALCFRREALISDALWNSMPNSTKRLACYEEMDEMRESKVFHFFTIEAKKAFYSIDDTGGKRQSLNNASQALHNMYEFFHDAGPRYEIDFFDKVRFFSVVASTEGLTIRIHRATKEPADGSDQGFITTGYPLRFEYREYCKIRKDSNFDRKTVLKTFERILIAYGADELQFLLHDAAEAIMEKLKKDPDGMKKREQIDFYCHGQTTKTGGSKKSTPAPNQASPAPSQALSEVPASLDMVLSGEVTPTQGRLAHILNAHGKRPRRDSDDILIGSRSH